MGQQDAGYVLWWYRFGGQHRREAYQQEFKGDDVVGAQAERSEYVYVFGARGEGLYLYQFDENGGQYLLFGWEDAGGFGCYDEQD